MPRRDKKPKPVRHLNGKQRPRSWHHNVHAGRIQQAKLDAVEPAFAAAEQDRTETAARASAYRREVRDFEELIVALARVPAECAFAALPASLL